MADCAVVYWFKDAPHGVTSGQYLRRDVLVSPAPGETVRSPLSPEGAGVAVIRAIASSIFYRIIDAPGATDADVFDFPLSAGEIDGSILAEASQVSIYLAV